MSVAGDGWTEPNFYFRIAKMKSSLAGGAKHHDFTANHGVFSIFSPIILFDVKPL
jgi:hypothetical protein